jgi:hypothetical protein
LYLLCIDRDAKPGFGHTDQVSLAFWLTLGLYQSERTDDPVRLYLREMSSVELLSREGEIAIAKRMEAGRETSRTTPWLSASRIKPPS